MNRKDQDVLIIDNVKGHLTNTPTTLNQSLTFSSLQVTILTDPEYAFNSSQKKAIDSFRNLEELAKIEANFDCHSEQVFVSKPYLDSGFITCWQYSFHNTIAGKAIYDWTFKYDGERNYYYVVDNINKKQKSLGAWKKEMAIHKK